MGIAGGCRTAELVDWQIGHIEDRGSVLPRVFTIVEYESKNTLYLQLCRMYENLRPKNVPHATQEIFY